MDLMITLDKAIEDASETLELNNIPEPRREAKSLLSLAIKKDHAFIIAHANEKLNDQEAKLFFSYVKRRSAREPFQHIAGKQEFWRLDFIVTPDVMIPRHETELIVEAGIKILSNIEKPTICEIGVGSGCISVSLLHSNKKAIALGVDISEKALEIAEQNAVNNNVFERIEFRKSDVFSAVNESETFDLLVSNPPYVPQKDVATLQQEVRNFDPYVALTDGKNGLSIIEKIIDESPKHLNAGGFLLMEMGFNQSNKVRRKFDLEIWGNVHFFADLQGIPRMVKAQLAD